MKNLKVRKTVIALSIVGGFTLSTLVGAEFYCAGVDHEQEYCHLCDIIGLEHQAKEINKGVNNFRYEAVYVAGEEGEVSSIDGNVIDIAHSSYTSKNKIIVNDMSGQYMIDDGYLKEYEPTGERVELYDTNALSGTKLIRVFKKNK